MTVTQVSGHILCSSHSQYSLTLMPGDGSAGASRLWRPMPGRAAHDDTDAQGDASPPDPQQRAWDMGEGNHDHYDRRASSYVICSHRSPCGLLCCQAYDTMSRRVREEILTRIYSGAH
jgi:hypothetical protein